MHCAGQGNWSGNCYPFVCLSHTLQFEFTAIQCKAGKGISLPLANGKQIEWDVLPLSSKHLHDLVSAIKTTGPKVLGMQFILAHYELQKTKHRLFYCADEIRNTAIRKTTSFRTWLPPGVMILPYPPLLRAGILAFGYVLFGFPSQLAVLGQALNCSGIGHWEGIALLVLLTENIVFFRFHLLINVHLVFPFKSRGKVCRKKK